MMMKKCETANRKRNESAKPTREATDKMAVAPSLPRLSSAQLFCWALLLIATKTTTATPTSPLLASQQQQQPQHQQTFYQTLGGSGSGASRSTSYIVSTPTSSAFEAQAAIGSDGQHHHHQQQHQVGPTSDALAIQLALISAKGALAFWRLPPAAGVPADGLGSLQQQQHFGGATFATKKAPASSGVCPQLPAASGLLNHAHPHHHQQPKSLSSTQQLLSMRQQQQHALVASGEAPSAVVAAQLVAVEGTSLRLNFVIVGHRFAAGSSPPQTTIINNNNRATQAKLKLLWTRNGEPLAINSARARFRQQIINENDIMRQFSSSSPFHINANGTASSSGMAASSSSTTSSNQLKHHHHQPIMSSDGGGGESAAADNFMLAPHVNEPLIGRVDKKLAEAKLIQSIVSKHRAQSLSLNLVDDFLADGQAIDWPKLEAYLRSNSRNMGLYLPPVQRKEQQPQDEDGGERECANLLTAGPPDQLTIIQLEMGHLSMQDRGLYQLRVCLDSGLVSSAPAANPAESSIQSSGVGLSSNHNQCQQSDFVLQIAEDVPVLESRPEHRILEPGDRMSLKCEATGFTLPQITWFLDDQQLNEHQLGAFSAPTSSAQLDYASSAGSSSSGAASSMFAQLVNGGASGGHLRLRIGDYVSQDNHVHSFVNSSHVQLSEGGFYKCQASNGYHTVEHESRIDVRGPPVIARRLANMSVLVGQSQVRIQCPYSGHPISSIEWYYRPAGVSGAGMPAISGASHAGHRSSSFMAPAATGDSAGAWLDYSSSSSAAAANQFRAKRGPNSKGQQAAAAAEEPRSLHLQRQQQAADAAPSDSFLDAASGPQAASAVATGADLDADKEPDPDRDEWLSQASAMTPQPGAAGEDYPDPLPDYPPPSLIPSLLDYDTAAADSFLVPAVDYRDIAMDLQQDEATAAQQRRRKKRETNGGSGTTAAQDQQQQWVKFPQSRRHQVHLNGTLIIQDVNRSDQGFYKCRALQAAASGGASELSPGSRAELAAIATSDGGGANGMHVASSNEFHLTVLEPPVISPFASADSLREGMRNLLVCSVIEGDSPVKLRWLKDGQPIEEYIQFGGGGESSAATAAATSREPQAQQSAGLNGWNQQQPQPQQPAPRIRVETSNEYTSTLYFSHVDFKDNGNYTCLATNKAASVNYTARMLVNVPPKWIRAPKDLECVSGQNIVIDCQAQAHPNPRVWWEIGLHSPLPSPLGGEQHQTAATGNGHSPSSSQSSLLSQSKSSQQQQQDQLLSVAPPGGAAQAAALLLSNQPPNHYRTIISNSRIHILENASLVIRDVSKQDQGYYLCQAANNFGSLSSLIKLTVNVGASFSSKYLMKYVKLKERVELDCDPIGQSPVDVTWLIRHSAGTSGHHQFNHTSGAATPAGITTTTSLHTHSQHATANLSSSMGSNAAARATSQQEELNVQQQQGLGRRLFMGTIRTELYHAGNRASDHSQQAKSVQEVSGSGGAFSDSDPAGQLQLVQQLEQQRQRHAAEAGLAADLGSSMSFDVLRRPGDTGGGEFVRLTIKQARRVHSADFICQASNRYGTDEKLIKLLVQEAPDPVQEISAVQVDSRSVSLAWLAPYNGNSPINSYTVEWAQAGDGHSYLTSNGTTSAASSNQQHHQPAPVAQTGGGRAWSHMIVQQPAVTIAGLQPMSTYEIRVRANNQLGQSAYANTPPALVTTTEEAPTSPPSDIKVVPLSSSSLQLSWLSPETAPAPAPTADNKPAARYSVKGYYLGYKVAGSNESFVYKTVSLMQNRPSTGDDDDDDNSGDHLIATQEMALNSTSGRPAGSSQQQQQQQDAASRRLRVVINELKRSTKYAIIVQAFNSAGPGPQSDQVEARTLLNDPPPAPMLRVGLVTYSTIELQWSFQLADAGSLLWPLPSPAPLGNSEQASAGSGAPVGGVTAGGASASQLPSGKLLASPAIVDQQRTSTAAKLESSVDGYHLYYRPAEGHWLEKKLAPETHTIIATNHQRNDLSIVETTDKQQQQQQPDTLQQPDNQQQQGWHYYSNLGAGNNKNSSSSSLSPMAFKSFRFILDQLACGSQYQIYLVAYNSIGAGLPSQIIRTKTRGAKPIAPRRQDFIQPNSTRVQLNFDAWMDGGCSISNFEIRYRQLENGATGRTGGANMAAVAGHLPQAADWLLLSSNVSPEQRSIELRDLQPETWYAILTSAESAAGKTEAQYSFMTLDKHGQVPIEAMEPPSTLPALFRSNGSIRSIWYNLFSSGPSSSSSSGNAGGGGAAISPLIMSACMCLILVATCSLFLIRRYNSLMKDTASSVDSSQTASGPLSGGSHYLSGGSHGHGGGHHPPMAMVAHQHHHHHHHDDNGSMMEQQQQLGMAAKLMGGGGANSNHYGSQEQYSLKSSPCKTNNTILTGSVSTNASSSAAAAADTSAYHQRGLGNTSAAAEQSVDLSQYLVGGGGTHHAEPESAHTTNDQSEAHHNCPVYQMQFTSATVHQQQQQHSDDQFCTSAGCKSSPGKFTSLTREGLAVAAAQAAAEQTSRFKTMPHPASNRPVSSFLPNQHQQQQQQAANYSNGFMTTGRPFICNGNQQQQQQQRLLLQNQLMMQNDYQQHLADQQQQQQQIYSKLRLIYNSNSSYNLCPDQKIMTTDEPTGGAQQQQIYNGDAINLAVLSQHQHHQMNQKMLACTLKKGASLEQQQQQSLYKTSQGIPAGGELGHEHQNVAELNSLLMDTHCQQEHQHQQQQMLDCSSTNSSNPYDQYQVGQQLGSMTNGAAMTAPAEPMATSGNYRAYLAPSIGSLSTHTTFSHSTQPTTSSSISNNSNNSNSSSHPDQQQQQQLINLATCSGVGGVSDSAAGQCGPKMQPSQPANHNMMNGGTTTASNQQPQQQQQAGQSTNNEQNDYALPFPPKWV